MAKIFWRVGGGEVHEIPEGATVVVIGAKELQEVWVDGEGNVSAKLLMDFDADPMKCFAKHQVNCPLCGLSGGFLRGNDAESQIAYCMNCGKISCREEEGDLQED